MSAVGAASGLQSLLFRPCPVRISSLVTLRRAAGPGSRHVGGGGLHHQHHQHQRHSLCATATVTAAATQQPDDSEQQREQQREPFNLLALLVRCRTIFICTAALAAAAFLSPSSSGLPFASLALNVETGAGKAVTGLSAAAKAAWAGLAAGVLHTLCGPDHLAALTPLTIGRSRVAATALGALWGFGHSTGQLFLGLLMVLLKDRFHDFVPALEKWSGTIIALTLIAIGLMGVWETYFEKEEDGQGHAEEEQAAITAALAGGGSVSAARNQSTKAGLATYATGILYGLQPDALFVVIPALALPTKIAAVAYCSCFVFGTVAAMGGYTAVIGTTSAALIKEQPWVQKHLSTIASGIAIVVGVLMLLAGLGFDVPFFG